jgi:uncharacterized membrane protein
MLPYSVPTTSRLSYTLKLEALGSLATMLLAISLIDVTFHKTVIMRSSQRIYLETFIQKRTILKSLSVLLLNVLP